MQIRTEAPADILTIDSLLKNAFPSKDEAKLVRALRENSRFTLSVVACSDEGQVIGHALFTPVTLDGEDFGWQGLAPVAVHPQYRKQGIAEQLIKYGFDSLYELGYSACVVLGDPNYYARFGFQDGEPMGLVSIYNSMPEYQAGAFQVLQLIEDCFTSKAGLVEYSPEFNG
ncbi:MULTISPECIES: GNAT family N-acetyltransferase [Vibrio]|uniref:GNAT family N-acetyltransferase n=1 Tax=Vibrio algicola TaxID=2662262 RepID=A0A5Q0TJ66_9VIBR|nr:MULTISPECIES: N-acetyltransferase [Vibrio]MBD1576111.1 N-acetyltransferase [Vibrio sp. S11_S32]